MAMLQSHVYTLGGLKRFFTIVILCKLIYLLTTLFSFSWIMIMLTYSTGSQSNLYRQNYINTHLHLISIIFSADTLFFKKIFEPIQMNVMSQGRIFKQHLTQNSIVFAKVSYCQEFAHLKNIIMSIGHRQHASLTPTNLQLYRSYTKDKVSDMSVLNFFCSMQDLQREGRRLWG